MDTTIRDHDDRFEIFLGGDVAGVARFADDGVTRTFFHTEVVPQLRGRGLAAELVSHALENTRRAGKQIVPACSYVADYVRRHAEYHDLLDTTDA